MSFFSNIKKIAGVDSTPKSYAPTPEQPATQAGQNAPFDAEYLTQSRTGAPMELRMVYPTAFSDVAPIARDLMDHRTVVINMENTAPDVMRRLLDFLSGVAFCIGGQLQQIGTRTYIITPPTIDVTGEQFAQPAPAYTAPAQEQPPMQQAPQQQAYAQPQMPLQQEQQAGAYPTFDPFRIQ